MLFMIGIAVGGTILVIALAVRVGDRQAEQQGWDRIAAERRRLSDFRRTLDERAAELYRWESELVNAAQSARCPACELHNRRGLPPAGG